MWVSMYGTGQGSTAFKNCWSGEVTDGHDLTLPSSMGWVRRRPLGTAFQLPNLRIQAENVNKLKDELASKAGNIAFGVVVSLAYLKRWVMTGPDGSQQP